VDLSRRRVANVRDALVEAGVSGDRIERRFGAKRPSAMTTEPCAKREGRVG
jgi:outer membrane protein OmpA-like peptidoglycan-associated protein